MDAPEELRALLIKAALVVIDVVTVYVTLTPEVTTRSVRLFEFTRLTTMGVEIEHKNKLLHKSPRVFFTPCNTARINKGAVDSAAVIPVIVCVACTAEIEGVLVVIVGACL